MEPMGYIHILQHIPPKLKLILFTQPPCRFTFTIRVFLDLVTVRCCTNYLDSDRDLGFFHWTIAQRSGACIATRIAYYKFNTKYRR